MLKCINLYKFKNDIPETIKNTEEWIGASGLEDATKNINYNSFSNGSCNLYNAGDLPTDFKLIVNIENNPTNITLKNNEDKIIGSLNYSDDIKNVISTLKEREQEVVKMRYGLDDTERYTLEEIGNIYGVTKECIRQTELRALKKMKMTGENLLSCYIY